MMRKFGKHKQTNFPKLQLMFRAHKQHLRRVYTPLLMLVALFTKVYILSKLQAHNEYIIDMRCNNIVYYISLSEA